VNQLLQAIRYTSIHLFYANSETVTAYFKFVLKMF